MAKRKTPKADKVIDLKPKAEKITDKELNLLQSTIKTIEHFTNDIGRLEIQKNILIQALMPHQKNIEVMRKEFNEEYGTDEINIQDGTINYPPENGETDKKD
tara:strand:- start:768 stop:1073 length:306 start_codon:yes stop_codon:yes gene_type:complete